MQSYVFVAKESGKVFVYYNSELPRRINQLFFSPDGTTFYGLEPLDYIGDNYKHSLLFRNPHPIELYEMTLECNENVITHEGDTYRLDHSLTFDRTNQNLLRVIITTEEQIEEQPIQIIKAKTEK